MMRQQNLACRFASASLLCAVVGLGGCSSEEDRPTLQQDGDTPSLNGDGDDPSGDGDDADPSGDGDGGMQVGDGDVSPNDPRARIPREGTSWLFIGQDVQSINDYAASVSEPQGIVGYTSLESLEALDSSADHGAGPNHLDHLADLYPDARIAIGLYLIDYLDQINSGMADENIARLAQVLLSYDRTVLLRIGYEFDATWTHQEPEAYKSAYQRIADGIRNAGADHVAFVWQSAALCEGRFMGHPLESWWPGDDYVDWVGLSYFTQVSCGYMPIQEVVSHAREKGKPVFIAEATPQGFDLSDLTFSSNGEDFSPQPASDVWSKWFAPFFQFVSENSDVIRGVTYINAHWDAQGQWDAPYENGYWGDSRVQANEEILMNWKSALAEGGWDRR